MVFYGFLISFINPILYINIMKVKRIKKNIKDTITTVKTKTGEELEKIKDRADDKPNYQYARTKELLKARTINIIFIILCGFGLILGNWFIRVACALFIVGCVRSLMQIKTELNLRLKK